MKKIFVIAILLSSSIVLAQPKVSIISSMPGAFSRLGFGARGMGMGNAMSAVIDGNLVSYYNPAVVISQKDNSFQASYSFLSLDRSLNFLNFTRRFNFGDDNYSGNASVPKEAGLSVGLINSGVSKIDGRDEDGNQSGNLSTSENQFFIAFSKSFSSKLALGLGVKFYYYHLYDKLSANGFGLDIGAIYTLTNNFSLSFVISDLNSAYKWDTSQLYGEQGTTTNDTFPVLEKIGVCYTNVEVGIIADVELENSNSQTDILRGGVEYNIYENLFFRVGVDQLNLRNSEDT
ncbi:MAG: PorV/PorQ family protein [Ignavibacteriaceae bacterium]